MQQSIAIPAAIVIGGLIVAGAVYISIKPSGNIGGDSGTYKGELVRPVDTSDHILGNPTAPIKIITYSDFDCPYCKTFDATLNQLIANEGTDGDVALVFRHFPLAELHPNALSHARAAECIASTAGNEAFFKFSSALFAGQPTDPKRYGEVAASVGITGDAFATCYASESATKPLMDRVAKDRDNARAMGAKGTPFSVIVTPGQAPIVLDGAYSYDALRQILTQVRAATPAQQ